MIQYPSSLDWLESLFNIEEEKEPLSVADKNFSCMSTVAASASGSPQATKILTDSSSSSILDIDPTLLTMLLQITDGDIPCTAVDTQPPMNSNEQRSDDSAYADELALGLMKADAARDFNDWKQTKRLIKRLSRHDSTLSDMNDKKSHKKKLK